jgi:tetratricopeptide (TPR) repeat protein
LEKASPSGGERIQLLAEKGYAYGAAGRQDDARAVIDQLLALQRQRADGSAGALATVYAALGDRDRAFAWLDQARQSYDPVITRIKVDPRFDKLRSDARFAKLLATVGLAQ